MGTEKPPLSGKLKCKECLHREATAVWKSAKMQRVFAGAAGPGGRLPDFPWLFSGACAMAAIAPGSGDHPAVGEGLLILLQLLISRPTCHQEKTEA